MTWHTSRLYSGIPNSFFFEKKRIGEIVISSRKCTFFRWLFRWSVFLELRIFKGSAGRQRTTCALAQPVLAHQQVLGGSSQLGSPPLRKPCSEGGPFGRGTSRSLGIYLTNRLWSHLLNGMIPQSMEGDDSILSWDSKEIPHPQAATFPPGNSWPYWWITQHPYDGFLYPCSIIRYVTVFFIKGMEPKIWKAWDITVLIYFSKETEYMLWCCVDCFFGMYSKQCDMITLALFVPAEPAWFDRFGIGSVCCCVFQQLWCNAIAFCKRNLGT